MKPVLCLTVLGVAALAGFAAQAVTPATNTKETKVTVDSAHAFKVKTIDGDEKSLAAIGQWPWPRVRMAELVDRIAGQQPLAIGIDLLFPEADRFSPAAMALSLPVMPTSP